MQVGNCWLKLNIYGSTVYKRNVSPAEVAVLQEGFRVQANGAAIEKVYVIGDSDTKDHVELKRLRNKYSDLRNAENKNAVNVTFPGMATLPQRFTDLQGIEVEEGEPESFKPKDSPTMILSEEETLAIDNAV